MVCPICGSADCKITDISIDWVKRPEYSSTLGFVVLCKYTKIELVFSKSVYDGDDIDIKRRLNMMCYISLNEPLHNNSKRKFKFFFDEHNIESAGYLEINLAKRIDEYPWNNLLKADMALENLATVFPNISMQFNCAPYLQRLLFCEEEQAGGEIIGIFKLLNQLGYIFHEGRLPEAVVSGMPFSISASGWKRVYELKKQDRVLNQGFIAMSFNPKYTFISEAFKRAISRCGYQPRIMSEKEHNNQIVPEIFFEIRQSKFVVVDITCQNHGAYYEAGYAEALNKQVIICCKKTIFNGEEEGVALPHFDIAQKAAVVWTDEADLEERLYKRIEATVGLKHPLNKVVL
jgi:nucleoside 2-deoxyribosyltransferase